MWRGRRQGEEGRRNGGEIPDKRVVKSCMH